MKLKCDNCGEIDHIIVDGYSFGDRLLEGVSFMVKDENGKPKAFGVTPACQDYFDDLNQKKWLGACEDYCEHLDIAQCPKCGDDVVVWGNPVITGIVPKTGTWIPITRGSDLIKNILERQRK